MRKQIIIIMAWLFLFFAGAVMAVAGEGTVKTSGNVSVGTANVDRQRIFGGQAITENFYLYVAIVEKRKNVLFDSGKTGVLYFDFQNRSREVAVNIPVVKWSDKKALKKVKSGHGTDSAGQFSGFKAATVRYAFFDDKGKKVLEDTVLLGVDGDIEIKPLELSGRVLTDYDRVFFTVKAPATSGNYDLRVLFDNTGLGKTGDIVNDSEATGIKTLELFFRAELWIKGIRVE